MYLLRRRELMKEEEFLRQAPAGWSEREKHKAQRGTISWRILQAHNQSEDEKHLCLKPDMMISDDLSYVAILQTAKASGLDHFPIPYVLSNCHKSLHAVGGTIDHDDHVFGLSAVRKYGGIYIPPHVAVMHQYMRETMAGGGKLALGSDSHTRYGALGTMSVGEGGGEVVKQLLGDTYDVDIPETVAVYLEGRPNPGVGPQDVALALIREVYGEGFVKNRILEFVGPGIASLSMDFRNGIDVMTAETACWTSVWETDDETRNYLRIHGREEDYRKLQPEEIAWYDKAVWIDLGSIHPMIALPFHPSNAYEIREFLENGQDLLRQVEKEAVDRCGERGRHLNLTGKIRDRKFHVDQAVVSGCAGGLYENIMEIFHTLKQGGAWDFARMQFSVYPASLPIMMELMANGTAAELMKMGVILKTAFCGPCIGAGDTPAQGDFSIRHVTRNFLNREGAHAKEGQIAAVALMDARSIAATAANGGVLTSAEELAREWSIPVYHYDASVYKRQVPCCCENRHPEEKLVYGTNIKDWPEVPPMKDKLLLQVCGKILDDVTTTDDLCPSGEAISYRANPERMAEFTLAAKDPEYVGRTRKTMALSRAVKEEKDNLPEAFSQVLKQVQLLEKTERGYSVQTANEIQIGSLLYARRPGDGSSREQAASSQRVLGGLANICQEYGTKRYRTNLINWGMLPLQTESIPEFEVGDWVYIPDVYKILEEHSNLTQKADKVRIKAWIISGNLAQDSVPRWKELSLFMLPITEKEREIICAGNLINYNRKKRELKAAYQNNRLSGSGK